ncbi:MAG: hypothetical protein ACREBJ_11145 [Nitrosotalea sp.]
MKKTRMAISSNKKIASKINVPLEPIPDDIIEFVLQYRIIKGKPFSFDGREYLIGLYRSPVRQINILKARQMEITEMAINWLMYHLLRYDGTYGLYVTDRQSHVEGFVDRMRLAISTSEKLKRRVASITNSSIKFVNGSVLYMITGWNKFEGARSYAIDFAVVDEAQSLDLESLPVIQETLSKSIHRRLLIIGTGSDEGSDWHKVWSRGTQMKWNEPKQVEEKTVNSQFSAGIG